MNRFLSFALSALLLLTAFVNPTIAQASKAESLRRKVIEWGTNKQVNVKLNSGEKVSGRIAEIQNDFFAVQAVTKDGKVSSQQINFGDIHKLSAKGKAGRIAGHTTLGVLAGVGAIFVMLFVIYATTDS